MGFNMAKNRGNRVKLHMNVDEKLTLSMGLNYTGWQKILKFIVAIRVNENIFDNINVIRTEYSILNLYYRYSRKLSTDPF